VARLQNRLLLRLQAFALVPAVLLTAAGLWGGRALLLRSLESRLAETRSSVVGLLESMQRDMLIRSRTLALQPALVDAVAGRDRQALLGIGFEAMGLLGVDALEVTDRDGVVLMRAQSPGRYGDDASGEAEFAIALQGESHLGILQHDGGLGLMAAVPILSEGRQVGALSVVQIIDYELLEAIHQQREVELSLFNGPALQATTIDDPAALAAIQAALPDGELWIHGEEHITTAHRFMVENDAGGGRLLLAEPTREVTELMRVMWASAGALIVVLGVTATLVSVRFSNSLARPVLSLRRSAEAMATGDLTQRVRVESDDELGELADAFNTMAETLLHSTTSIEALNQEVDERRRLEAESERLRQLLRDIIDSMPSALIVFDPQGRVQLSNQRASALLGLAPGGSLEDLPPRLAARRAVLDRAIEDRAPQQGRSSYVDDTGRIRSEELTAWPLSDALLWAALRIDDVTAREELESRLRQSQKMDAVGQLASGIAHDFNNQIQVIRTYIELLRDVLVDPEDIEAYEAIKQSAISAAELTGKLLVFSRKNIVFDNTIDLNTVALDVVGILKRSIDRRIVVETALSDAPALIAGDRTLLQSAVLNLGLNARDAIETRGQITVSTEIVEDGGPLQRRSVCIRVSDDGAGMDETTRDRIFEPFFTTKGEGKGTGLGLAAVYGTVQQHSGVVEVESQRGEGTTFTIWLPFSERRTQPGAMPSVGRRAGAGGRLMIVDDEATIVAALGRQLRRAGYSCECFTHPRLALEWFREHADEVDLVILDMILPEMDGAELFAQLRRIRGDLPGILASGYGEPARLDSAAAVGLRQHLQKPFSEEELLSAVALALGDESAARLRS
jgi:PAS domain S-box-containing protein